MFGPVRRRLAALTAVCLVPLGVLACGGGEQDLSSWIDQADAICRQAQASADDRPAPDTPFPGDALRRTAEQSRSELDQLRALDPPAQQATGVGEYLATLNVRIEALENTADALDAAPASGPLPSSESLQDYTNEAFTLAVALGLEDCAGGVDFAVDTTTSTALSELETTESTTPVLTAPSGQPLGEEITEDKAG